MLAHSLARVLTARGIHYGWVMVGLTMAYVVCSSATVSIPGVLLVPMSRELGWSIGDLSGPLGLRMVLFGAVAPFAGGLIVLYGPRTVVTGAAMLLVGGLLLSVAITEKWELWLGLGIILGTASGMTSLVLVTIVATRWFTARRGLVVGILSAGTATGQLIFLPAAAWLAQHYGWRTALLPSVIVIALLAVAFVLFARDRPADLGLPPFGENSVERALPPVTGNLFAVSLSAFGAASHTLAFWVLGFTFFICGVSSFGLVPHFVTLCGDFGVSPIVSTNLMVLIGICDLFGTLGSGWLSDGYDSRYLLAWYYGLRGLSLLWLPYSDFTLVGLSAFAVFYGLDFIATVPPTVRLTVNAFGREQAPLVFAWIFAIHQVGAGVWAVVQGEARDILASYLPTLFAAGVLCLFATLSLLLLRGRSGSAALVPRDS